MRAIDLRHRELEFGRYTRVWYNEIADMVQDPSAGLGQVTIGSSMLTICGGKLKLDGLFLPAVDVLGVAESAAQSPVGPAQMESEVQAVFTGREAEVDFSGRFKPPSLHEVCHGSESA